jgi:hypothetical protein
VFWRRDWRSAPLPFCYWRPTPTISRSRGPYGETERNAFQNALATADALSGKVEHAQKAMARLRQIDPDLRVSNLKDLTPLRRPEDMAKYSEGMREAGLPE